MAKSKITILSLIEALQIFAKYMKEDSYEYGWPTNCSHDVLAVLVNPDVVSKDDANRLEELGFFPDGETGECFISFHFGSA